MRLIVKAAEPQSLTEHRARTNSDFDNYPGKDDLRHALFREQQGLCCYCMNRIRPERVSMKIEHWKNQRRFLSEQLNYRNLLGACLGGEGKPPHHQHCDTRKGDNDLKWNPANPTHHIQTRVRYELDGSIYSNEADFNEQLNDVLNLNLPKLKNNRKTLLDGVLEWWKREKSRIRGHVPRNNFVRKRDQFINSSAELRPYCQVAVWWLDQKIAKMPL